MIKGPHSLPSYFFGDDCRTCMQLLRDAVSFFSKDDTSSWWLGIHLDTHCCLANMRGRRWDSEGIIIWQCIHSFSKKAIFYKVRRI